MISWFTKLSVQTLQPIIPEKKKGLELSLNIDSMVGDRVLRYEFCIWEIMRKRKGCKFRTVILRIIEFTNCVIGKTLKSTLQLIMSVCLFLLFV